MSECLFCNIASGGIPADIVYQDDDFVAFRDIDPQAPVHVLLIPRRHIESLNDLAAAHSDLMGRMNTVAAKVSAELGLAGTGYRWVLNCGEDGCQTVPHLHLNILGGRRLGWPPG